MNEVYNTIKDWLSSNDKTEREVLALKDTLLNRVNFIWYEVDQKDEISIFTRINIGKIPLTDSELIKALFLNASYFNLDNNSQHDVDAMHLRIAQEWDQIEYRLQNDEFWSFIYFGEYTKPTRIDFILDLICKNNALNSDSKNNDHSNEHETFRYFYDALNKIYKIESDHTSKKDKIENSWKMIKKYYQILDEWYNDYRLYHYIGFLSFLNNKNFQIPPINMLIQKWEESSDKTDFIKEIKKIISGYLSKLEWISNIATYQFDTEQNKPKTDCVGVLLLHNIETIVQQNEQLVSEAKYNLPNFTKFPFHLFQRENWQVEHIKPNAGDKLRTVEQQKLYLSIALEEIKVQSKQQTELEKHIDAFLKDANGHKDFQEIFLELSEHGIAESVEDQKNCISNFVLLDETTNKEYGNQIFPVKRAFIINKEKGYKINFKYNEAEHKAEPKEPPVKEVAFIPPCTKFVFSKQYTKMPASMLNWDKNDASEYLKDIQEKLNKFPKNSN